MTLTEAKSQLNAINKAIEAIRGFHDLDEVFSDLQEKFYEIEEYIDEETYHEEMAKGA